jgi:hypothetical protein
MSAWSIAPAICGAAYRADRALSLEPSILWTASQERSPFNDGASGLRVVQMIEAINQSMSQKGKMVYCNTSKPALKVTA